MKILFITSTLGGGVGRVISILTEELKKNKYETNILVLDKKTKNKKSIVSFLIMFWAAVTARVFCDKERASVLKFYSRNYRQIKSLKKTLKEYKNGCVISFLNEPIFLTLLAKNKKNRVIISERNDPEQFIGTKTTMAFIHKMYPKADMMVCQSPDAKKWYDNNSSVKSTVIFNPVKADLPKPFSGVRQKKIVNFCRISDQKNLILLADAFALLSKDYPEYEMFVYGDPGGNGAEGYKEEVEKYINEKSLSDKMFILPGRKDIHEHIKDYAMFVSSSDFEGMSNSMLEAMALGMPVVCTDCPAGGARAVIQDHVNGILTPVGDAEALHRRMKEIIENPELAKKLGENASKIREEQSVEKITEKWLEVING